VWTGTSLGESDQRIDAPEGGEASSSGETTPEEAAARQGTTSHA